MPQPWLVALRRIHRKGLQAMFVLIVVVRANALPVRDYFNFYPELKVAVNTIVGRGPAGSRSAD